ncbi:vacuolar protein sorting-associated protein 54-like, partial [Diaphorina citri]|uniref:Vacuolar protein sorting-associated protein 54 n=1 Tax=Diaphorina citri TaxID=121845 RepID=A0A3Q0IUX4_DIACI
FLLLFFRHLRENHCKKEGGSYVCTYAENNVCSSLPIEGVNDNDYEKHVYKHHAMSNTNTSTDNEKLPSSAWNIYSASQNLPAVLNDPSKGKQKDLFTKTWGDHFVELHNVPAPSYLPEISKHHFDNYLKKISKRCKRRSRLSETSNSIDSPGETSILSNLNFSSSSKNYTHFDLSEIPKIYLKSDFKLSNLETFSIVFPQYHQEEEQQQQGSSHPVHNQCDIALSSSPPSYHNSSKLLQEKLSHYLDIVEVQIAIQVANKSDAFFHAMSSHDTIMEQLGQTIVQVKNLRCKLKNIDETQVKTSLKLIQKEKQRSNQCKALEKLRLMSSILQTQPTIQIYLSTPNYVAALELIEKTKDILNSELYGIQSFRHLLSELKEMTKMIDTLMIQEFERFVSTDLNRPLTETDLHVIESEKLVCIVLGLLKQESLEFLNIYRKEVDSAIKAIIKSCAIEIVSSSNFSFQTNHSSELTSLDDQIKYLNILEWLHLLKNCTHSLGLLLLRIKATCDVMMGAIPSDNHEARGKVDQVLCSTCQYALNRCAYLLSKSSVTYYNESKEESGPKSAGHWLSEKASLNHLTELQGYVNSLSQICERILPPNSNNIAMILKLAFKSEAIKLMQRYHAEQRSRLEMILESESWRKADVPCELEALLGNIINHGCFTSNKLSSSSSKQYLEVNNEKYAVIGTVLILISMISEYCSRAEEITLVTHILPRYIGDLIQIFNSLSCKLVLGGEAVSDKTGLKKITTYNLALALRALQLILYLIPFVVVHFEGLLGENAPLSHLHNVSDRIRDHIRDIRLKLLSIMGQVLNAELKYWEVKAPMPSKSFLVSILNFCLYFLRVLKNFDIL